MIYSMKKINYNQLLQLCAITSSFDISFIVYLIGIINNFILRVLGGFIFTLGIIMLSYHLVYLFYKKKGMIIKGSSPEKFGKYLSLLANNQKRNYEFKTKNINNNIINSFIIFGIFFLHTVNCQYQKKYRLY